MIARNDVAEFESEFRLGSAGDRRGGNRRGSRAENICATIEAHCGTSGWQISTARGQSQ